MGVFRSIAALSARVFLPLRVRARGNIAITQAAVALTRFAVSRDERGLFGAIETLYPDTAFLNRGKCGEVIRRKRSGDRFRFQSRESELTGDRVARSELWSCSTS